MTETLQFPFTLSHAFFTSLRFQRVAQMPGSLQLHFSIRVKVGDKEFPDRLQVDLKVETSDDQPLSVSIEMVGLFDLIEGEPKPEGGIVPEFVNERAFFMMWPYVSQMVRIVTGQMGMNPVQLVTPYRIQFLVPENREAFDEIEKEEN